MALIHKADAGFAMVLSCGFVFVLLEPQIILGAKIGMITFKYFIWS